MAASSPPIIVQPSSRLFTAADLAVFPTWLPSGDIDYELDQGKLIVTLPPRYDESVPRGRLGFELFMQGEERGHGRAFPRVGVVISTNPDTVFAPHAVFIKRSRLPIETSPEDYIATIPDLVVEVRGKHDSQGEIERKVTIYLSVGVEAVWVADPEVRTVAIHRQRVAPQVLGESDRLALDDPIPGFRLDVAKIFV